MGNGEREKERIRCRYAKNKGGESKDSGIWESFEGKQGIAICSKLITIKFGFQNKKKV